MDEVYETKILPMILRMIIMTMKSYDYDEDSDDEHDQKDDSYTAAGAAD